MLQGASYVTLFAALCTYLAGVDVYLLIIQISYGRFFQPNYQTVSGAVGTALSVVQQGQSKTAGLQNVRILAPRRCREARRKKSLELARKHIKDSWNRGYDIGLQETTSADGLARQLD